MCARDQSCLSDDIYVYIYSVNNTDCRIGAIVQLLFGGEVDSIMFYKLQGEIAVERVGVHINSLIAHNANV